MNETAIKPEKITHPIQLMAAWFTTLVALVATFLTAAVNIEEPTWVPPFLAISSVVITLAVLVGVFFLLTVFRPHLQPSKEYSEWLKDERRFRGSDRGKLQTLQETRARGREVYVESSWEVASVEGFSGDLRTYPIEVSPLSGADSLVDALRDRGFRAKIYTQSLEPVNPEARGKQRAVWIGCRVPSAVAIAVLQIAIEQWPHLDYFYLSDDNQILVPDEIHDQIFIGGATETAQGYDLQTWNREEVNGLEPSMNLVDFHASIRRKYSRCQMN